MPLSTPDPLAAETRVFWRNVAWASLLGLMMLLALEATPLDIILAGVAFDPQAGRFPWRDHVFMTRISHDGIKWLSTLAFIWIGASIVAPFGILRRIAVSRRALLLAVTVVCLVVVSGLKRTSALHCPWDLTQFGGAYPYLRLFEATPDGWVRGACFPAGHALSGFAFVGGFFVFWHDSRRLAWVWLACALAFGAWAGLAQQWRGAHFFSHTLWTAWLCWSLSAAMVWGAQRRAVLRSPRRARVN